MTYEDAQKLLDNPTDENPVSQSLSSLYELYKVLHATRKANGLFTQMRDHLEYEFEKDEQKPVTVSLRHKKPTEMMVKEFLFLANKSVAQKISSQFPEQALLRRHAPPSERKIVSCVYICVSECEINVLIVIVIRTTLLLMPLVTLVLRWI